MCRSHGKLFAVLSYTMCCWGRPSTQYNHCLPSTHVQISQAIRDGAEGYFATQVTAGTCTARQA